MTNRKQTNNHYYTFVLFSLAEGYLGYCPDSGTTAKWDD